MNKELKKHNFIIIRLNVKPELQINRYLKLYNRSNLNRLNHISEKEQDEFPNELIDYDLESNDSILEKIDDIFKN